jgi:hypothetical protein
METIHVFEKHRLKRNETNHETPEEKIKRERKLKIWKEKMQLKLKNL